MAERRVYPSDEVEQAVRIARLLTGEDEEEPDEQQVHPTASEADRLKGEASQTLIVADGLTGKINNVPLDDDRLTESP
jgi:hypothetical protein